MLGAGTEVVGRCEDRLGSAQGDGMEKTTKCGHFTIRGYVADVRKHDAKTCWPLSIPHSQTVEALANSLPPLIVPDFRRWCCQNCLHSILISGTENGARIKDFSAVSKGGADNVLSSFQQPSGVGTFGVDVAEVGTSSVNANVKGSEVSPVLCHDGKELQNLSKESIGNHLSKLIHLVSEEIQHQPDNSAVAATEHKSLGAAEDIRENITVYGSNLNTTPHDKCINNFVCVKRSYIDLNCTYESDDISSGALPSDRTNIVASSHGDYDSISAGVKTKLLSGDVSKKNSVPLNGSCNQRDATLSITESPSTNQEVVNSDQTKDKMSCNVYLPVYVDDKKYGSKAVSSHGKSNDKKAPKVRLRSLEDIMRTPKDPCLPKRDAELSKPKSVHDGPCRLNCEAKHSCENKLTRQTAESTTATCLLGSQDNENYDEETSLNHWLMSVSKKSIANKGSSLSKHTEDRACNSIDTSCQKGVHHKNKSSRERPRETDAKEKENKRPRIQSVNPSPRAQQNLTAGDERINFVNSKTIQTRRRNVISKKSLHNFSKRKKTLHIDHQNIDNSRDEMCDSHNKPKKMLQVGVKSTSRKWPKKETRKKQIMTKKSGENLDDIPMDVVEILAKIQHEKHLPVAKFSTSANYSVPVPDDSCIARGCERNSCDTMHTNPDTSNDIEYAIHIRDQGFQFRPESCDSSKKQMRNLHIDLNQDAADSHQAMPGCISHNSFEVAPPFDNTKTIHSCQYLPCDKVKMQPFGFYYREHLSFVQGSSRTVTDKLSLPASDRIFGISMRMSCPEQSCVNIDSHNSYLKGKLVTAVEKSEEVRNPSDPYVLNVGWKLEQSTNKVPRPFEIHLIQGQNECHFGTAELSGSCSNDTVSATNLLRLVNQAALSGASLDRNSVANSGAWCSSPCSVIHGSDVGMRNKEMLNGPWRAACYNQGQNCTSISQPHRPVARIGVFSPSLQDEIMTRTNKYGTALDSEVRWADELPHLQINGKKAGYSYSPYFKSRNMDHTIFMRENMPLVSAGSSSVQGCDSRHRMDQPVISNKGKTFQHARNIYATEYCVLNRNPAEFTLPDDENEYMREVKV